MVENLVFMLCMLFIMLWVNGEMGCVINELFDIEINLYDVKLYYKVDEFNSVGVNILMLDFMKVLR